MKKMFKILMLVVVCLTMLVGCGTNLKGKYNIVYLNDGTVEMNKEELEAVDMDIYLEFKDGKFIMSSFGMAEEGTYKVNGKNVEMTIDDETIIGKINGKKITIEEDNEIMIFEKE